MFNRSHVWADNMHVVGTTTAASRLGKAWVANQSSGRQREDLFSVSRVSHISNDVLTCIGLSCNIFAKEVHESVWTKIVDWWKRRVSWECIQVDLKEKLRGDLMDLKKIRNNFEIVGSKSIRDRPAPYAWQKVWLLALIREILDGGPLPFSVPFELRAIPKINTTLRWEKC